MEAENKQLQGKNEYLQPIQTQPPRCANCDIDFLWKPSVALLVVPVAVIIRCIVRPLSRGLSIITNDIEKYPVC